MFFIVFPLSAMTAKINSFFQQHNNTILCAFLCQHQVVLFPAASTSLSENRTDFASSPLLYVPAKRHKRVHTFRPFFSIRNIRNESRALSVQSKARPKRRKLRTGLCPFFGPSRPALVRIRARPGSKTGSRSPAAVPPKVPFFHCLLFARSPFRRLAAAARPGALPGFRVDPNKAVCVETSMQTLLARLQRSPLSA